MTIYKPKTGDGKQPKVVKTPEVVPEGVPLADGKKKVDQLSAQLVIISAARRRRNNVIALSVAILIAGLAAICVAVGLYVSRQMNKPYVFSCGVGYHEGTTSGQFQEQGEIDTAYGRYEKLQVPPVLDSRRSTIVHDFEKNLTAIVDLDRARCFIMDLNRTIVQPPKDFFDMLRKLQAGYYVPDAEVVRDKYRVLEPQIMDLQPFGLFIWHECRYFDTYRLIRVDQPYAMSRKRSADKLHFRGTFALGETMGKYLQLVEIVN